MARNLRRCDRRNESAEIAGEGGAVEAVIFQRLQDLAQNPGSAGEPSALREAADTLLALKTDVLHYPGRRQESFQLARSSSLALVTRTCMFCVFDTTA